MVIFNEGDASIVKFFEFIHHVFLKRVIATILGLIFTTAFAFISFMCVRSMVAVTRGYHELTEIRRQNVHVGNNQSNSNNLNNAYQRHPKQLAEVSNKIISSLETTGDYAIHWSFDSEQKANDNSGMVSAPINVLTVNQNFFLFYPLSVEQGQGLYQEVFQGKSKSIPVLIGSNLSNSFPIGNEFKFINPSNGKTETYKVIGILRKNQGIQSMYQVDSKQYLNNTIVRPLRTIEIASVNPTQIFAGLQDLLIFGKANNQLTKISRAINSHDIFKIKFYTANENIDEFLKLYRRDLIPVFSISIIVLIITSVFLIWNTLKTIQDSRAEIILRRALGMSIQDIFLSTFILELTQSFIALIPAIGFSLYLTKFMKNTSVPASLQIANTTIISQNEITTLIVIFSFLTILDLIISFVMIKSVQKKSISNEVN